MSSLRETQENFQTYILHRESAIENQVLGSNLDFKQTRLDVYREGYSLRLLEILNHVFPVLRNLAGEELFEKLGRDYIAEYPSNHFSVGRFGRHFSKFLSSHVPSEPKFAELAGFEWALDEVIDAPDAPHITFEDMAAIPPESWAGLRLLVHPSLQLLPLFYKNIPLFWQNNNPDHCLKPCDTDQESTESPCNDAHAESESLQPELQYSIEPTTWLIWRFNLQAYYLSLSKEQLWMMQALRSGKCFAEVCEGLCEWLSEEQVTQFAAENLRNWIVEGLFSKIEVL